MELLVVVAIIGVATAMAMPSIAKFMRSQKLQQAGRVMQSIFNDARRASITQRSRHYVFIGKRPPQGVGMDTYAVHIFREGYGWEPGEPVPLPASVMPVLDATGKVLLGCGLQLQDWSNGLPPTDASDPNTAATVTDIEKYPIDGATKRPKAGVAYHELRKDGTIVPKGTGAKSCPPGLNSDLFDQNIFPEPGKYTLTGMMKGATQYADMAFVQVGDPSKVCFVSIDPNTGRVRFRVVEGENIANPGASSP